MIPVMILANPPPRKKKAKANMAKKKKAPKRKNGATRHSAKRKNPHRGRRRRRNPADGVSVWSIVTGVVVGGVAAGASDYALAGMESTATPTRRALIGGVATVGLGIGAAATSGFARGALAGAAGSFAGVAAANGARAIGVASLAKSDEKAVKAPAAQKPAMAALVPRAGAPELMPAAAMRALVAQRPAVEAAAARAGVAQLAPPRMVVGKDRLQALVRV